MKAATAVTLASAIVALNTVVVLGAPGAVDAVDNLLSLALDTGEETQPGCIKLPVTYDPITGILDHDGALRPGIAALLGARLGVSSLLPENREEDVEEHRRAFSTRPWFKKPVVAVRSVGEENKRRWFGNRNWRRNVAENEFKRSHDSELDRRLERENLKARWFSTRPWRRDSIDRRDGKDPGATQPATPAIHDDGWGIVVTPAQNSDGDNEWLVDLSVGTPSQKLSVVLDTGSSATWVYSPACCYAPAHRFFDPTSSSTFSNRTVDQAGHVVRASPGSPGQLWSQHYARGRAIEGSLAIDTIGFSSGNEKDGGLALSLPNSTIALTTSVIGQSREARKMEGLVGLAPGSANDVEGGWMNPFEVAADKGLLNKPYLTATLIAADRDTGKGGGGHYTVGDRDLEHSKDDVVFQDVTSKTFWGAEYDQGGLKIGSKDLSSIGNPNRRYIVDTGTAIVSLPSDMAAAAHKSIAGSMYPTTGSFVGYWLVPCGVGSPKHEASLPSSKRTPNLSISIRSHKFRVPAKDLVFQSYYPVPKEDAGGKSDMCISGIQKASSNEFIVLGLAFIKNHVVTFDFGSRPRRRRMIGIASRSDLPAVTD